MSRAGALLVAVLVVALTAACSDAPVTRTPNTPVVAPVTTTPVGPTQLVVGVEGFPPGFNPHLVADQSPVTTALSTLVLPSVFRIDSGGTPQLDPTIATSAHVTSTNPFTVSYELNLEASWSDNAPIAAEDFVYLWEQLRSQPGTVDAAGYRLISDVRSRAGGKAVDVLFSQPYPAWQHLFSGLLPAHLVKDAPGSWIGATVAGLPTSGGPFKVATVDRGRGEIDLTRNDAYWDTPTVLDQLVLRRLSPTASASGLATGDVDLAMTASDEAARSALSGLSPPPRLQTAPQPTVTQLALRTDSGPLRSLQVRSAVADLVDREAIRRAVAPESLPADALALAPSEPGYTATAPESVRPDLTAAAALLSAAGWRRDVVTGRWDTPDGQQARLVVGAAAERADDQRVAQTMATQLRANGIDVLVVAPAAAELFAQPTVPATPPLPLTPVATAVVTTAGPIGSTPDSGTSTGPDAAPTTTFATPAGGVAVDILVEPRTVGGDLGTELASDYGCPAVTTLVPDPPRAPTGFCLPVLNPLFARLMSPAPGTDTAAEVERIVWQQLAVLPLFQPVTLVASTAATDAATSVGPGPLVGGPLTGAQLWRPPAP